MAIIKPEDPNAWMIDQEGSAATQNNDSKKGRRQGRPQTMGQVAQDEYKAEARRNNFGSALFGDFGARSPIDSSGNGGPLIELFLEHGQKLIKEMNEKKIEGYGELSIVPFPKDIYSVRFSGVIITNTMESVTTAHTLVFEATGSGSLSPIVVEWDRNSYEYATAATEVIDEDYMSKVELAVSQQLGIDLDNVYSVDTTIVPAHQTFTPDTDEFAFKLLIGNAISAALGENLVSVMNFLGYSIEQMVENARGRFVVDIDMNTRDEMTDITDMPVRRDICMSLRCVRHQDKSSYSLNQQDPEVELVRIYGYIDFLWQQPIRDSRVHNTEMFAPVFQLTDITSQNLLLLPVMVLLALVNVVMLAEDQMWVENFLRKSLLSKGEINYNDIGMLNIEANVERSKSGYGEPLDTSSADFNRNYLEEFLDRCVSPDLLVSIDIPDAAPSTWFLSIFRYAALNDATAINRVNEAASVLLTGEEGNFDSGNEPIFDPDIVQIPVGFYTDHTGTRRDLREIMTYLGVAAFVHHTDQPYDVIAEYSATFTNPSIPEDVRMGTREGLLREIAKGSLVIKQNATRVILNGAWLTMVADDLAAIGYRPINNSDTSGTAFVPRASQLTERFGVSRSVRFSGRAERTSKGGRTTRRHRRRFD